MTKAALFFNSPSRRSSLVVSGLSFYTQRVLFDSPQTLCYHRAESQTAAA
jgi:hypothetical protein